MESYAIPKAVNFSLVVSYFKTGKINTHLIKIVEPPCKLLALGAYTIIFSRMGHIGLSQKLISLEVKNDKMN